MMIFSFLAIPLTLAFALTLQRFNKRPALWQMGLGFLSTLPMFILFALLEGSILYLNWAAPLSIVSFYFFNGFFLPAIFALLAYYLFTFFKLIPIQETEFAPFFFLTVLGTLLMARLAAFHHTFGLVELVMWPSLSIVLALLLGCLTPKIRQTNFLLLMLILIIFCLTSALACYFTVTHNIIVALTLAVLSLLVQLLTCKFITKFA